MQERKTKMSYKINWFKYVGINVMRIIIFSYTNIKLSIWEAIIITLAMILMSVEGERE